MHQSDLRFYSHYTHPALFTGEQGLRIICQNGQLHSITYCPSLTDSHGDDMVYAPDDAVSIHQALDAYFSEGVSLNVPCDIPISSPFITKCWQIIASIPFGQTITYGELAEQAGNRKASRAAGTACGKNRLPLFIPCHRVLAQGGKLGGFAWGLDVKRTLLAHEGIMYC